jgi:hypothetical protein
VSYYWLILLGAWNRNKWKSDFKILDRKIRRRIQKKHGRTGRTSSLNEWLNERIPFPNKLKENFIIQTLKIKSQNTSKTKTQINKQRKYINKKINK